MQKPYITGSHLPRLLTACLFTILSYSAVTAQTVAYQRFQSASQGNQIMLKQALDELQQHYQIIFTYTNEVVGEQVINSKKWRQQNNLDAALDVLMNELNLRYKKIDKTNYVIQAKTSPEEKRQKPVSTSSGDAYSSIDLANLTGSAGQSYGVAPIDFSVKGKVTEENGQPLPGVNVLLKGTTTGTSTNVDGTYTLNIPTGEGTLVFSLIGYTGEEVAIGNRTTIDVSLLPDIKSLSEVVVVGYGTVKKSDLTGSVGSVKEAQLRERPATSLTQALSGKIAGVQVNTNSGRPGGRTTIRVRGFSSINTSNNPLYVVDGVMLPQGTQAQFSSAIDYINPSDIVSVEVLKDASSTAIYGARGANGVILVTTKKGKSGEGQVTYNADLSMNVIGPNRPEVLNAKEYLAVEDLAYANMAKYDPVKWARGDFANLNPKLRRTDPRVFDSNGNPLYDTDWFKESTQNKLSQNHQLGFSGGNDRTQYSVSVGYRDDQGLIKTSYLKRYSGRFSIDDQIKKWLKVGGTLSYNNQSERLVDVNDAVARQIVEDFPFLPVKYADGTYANNRDYPNAEGTMSSVHRLMDRQYILNSQTTLGSLYSNITLAKGLEMKTILGVNILTQEQNESSSRTLSIGEQGTASARNRREGFWSLENYLTYNKQFSDIHSITALLGLSWQETNFFRIASSVRTFSTDYFGFNNLGAGALLPGVESEASRGSFNSYFGRINYSLKDKYLLTVTGRADGSSKFGTDHKYAFFPSAALAWRVSEEDFLKGSNVISNLKIRTSYGLTGNSEIPSYQSIARLSSTYATIYNDTKVGGTGISTLANSLLGWENTAQSDLGIELGLFKGRLSLEVDLYYRKTTDMLLEAPVPRTSGYGSIRKNVGSMENKGIELNLTSTNIDAGGFQWNTTFNISMNRNKVLSLATPSDIFGVGGPNFTNQTNIIRIGEPVGSFWGLTRLGTWSEAERDQAAAFTSYRNGLKLLPGDIKYLDVNGDNAITDADRSIIGNGSPKAWGAFTNTFKYKNLDLTLELQYSYGNDVMMMNLHASEDRQALANSYKTVLNAWTPTNQNTPIAEIRETRAGYVTNVDDHWVKDGSFLRGRNLLLGYTFPTSITSKMKLSRLRLYVSAQNFFLKVSDKVIGDPEVTPTNQGDGSSAFSQGMIWHNYPKPTIFMGGLQVAF
jgi:TonB-linked SusC/RagA family outer membrane protein